MTKGRDNAAESMKDVFALIRSRKQSGVLSVERFENGLFEEGEVHFQSGRPVQGYVGKLSGENALNHLLSWRRVYFAFSQTSTTPTSSSVNGISSSPQASSPSLPPVRLAPHQTGPLSSPTTEPLRGEASRTSPLQERTTGPLAYSGSHEIAALVPHKLTNQQDVMSLSLTRLQRSIYLLVDGRRSVSDLARFTGKGISEVLQVLVDLRARNLIRM